MGDKDMLRKRKPIRTVSVYFGEDEKSQATIQALNDRANRENRSVSQVIRLILEEKLGIATN